MPIKFRNLFTFIAKPEHIVRAFLFYILMLKDLEENTDIILPKDGLMLKMRQAQQTARPLVIKLVLDPTTSDLHLGYAVLLKKLRQCQEQGHEIVILAGRFTVQIGNPAGINMVNKLFRIKLCKIGFFKFV